MTLYATQADGSLGAAVWSGDVAEKLTVREKWINVETRPSGAAYPVQHPLVPQYEIAIDRVWALPLANLIGFQPAATPYILDVVWTLDPLGGEAGAGSWHRRTFYGVTISARSFAPQSIESEFTDGQEFLAEYFIPGSGVWGPGSGGAVGLPPVAANPLVVQWIGPDGTLPLYNYVSGFTEVLTGQAASRAVIAADGSLITFAGGSPVVATSATGVTVAQLHDSLPLDVPRLAFYQGATLLALVSANGLWARNIADTTLPGGGFDLMYEGRQVGAIAAGVTAALAWNGED